MREDETGTEGTLQCLATFSIHRGIVGRVALTGETVVVLDASAHPDFDAAVDEALLDPLLAEKLELSSGPAVQGQRHGVVADRVGMLRSGMHASDSTPALVELGPPNGSPLSPGEERGGEASPRRSTVAGGRGPRGRQDALLGATERPARRKQSAGALFPGGGTGAPGTEQGGEADGSGGAQQHQD